MPSCGDRLQSAKTTREPFVRAMGHTVVARACFVAMARSTVPTPLIAVAVSGDHQHPGQNPSVDRSISCMPRAGDFG